MSAIDDPGRQFLINALSAELFSLSSAGFFRAVWAMGKVAARLPAGKSIYDMQGKIRIDGKLANYNTLIKPGFPNRSTC